MTGPERLIAHINGSPFPGVKQVALDLGVSPRTVTRWITAICEDNKVRVDRSPGATGRGHTLTLNLKKSVTKKGDNLALKGDIKGDILGSSVSPFNPSSENPDNAFKESNPYGVTSTMGERWLAHRGLTRHKVGYLGSSTARQAEAFALKTHPLDDVLAAIDNYAAVMADQDRFWFTYRWTFVEFLRRGVAKFSPESLPLDNYARDRRKGPTATEIAQQTYEGKGVNDGHYDLIFGPRNGGSQGGVPQRQLPAGNSRPVRAVPV